MSNEFMQHKNENVEYFSITYDKKLYRELYMCLRKELIRRIKELQKSERWKDVRNRGDENPENIIDVYTVGLVKNMKDYRQLCAKRKNKPHFII